MNIGTFTKSFRRPVTKTETSFASKYRKNEAITAPIVWVIENEGEKPREMTIQEALQLAYNKELDLIEISPNSKPPVCKITSWSKFQYLLQKKEKQAKKKEKKLKEFWFKAGIGIDDLNRKVRRAKEFLDKGHPVKITLIPTKRVLKQSLNEIFEQLLTNFNNYSKISDVQNSQRKMSVTFKAIKSGKNQTISSQKV